MARFVALIAVLLLVSTVSGNKNDTDSCLNNVNQWTQLIPKTIDDILKSDIFALMADIGQATALWNKTKDSCSNLDFNDITNQTSVDTFRTCYNSTEGVVAAFNQLIADVSTGNVSAIIQDVGALIAAGNNVVKQCNATIPIIENIRLLANFYNSSLCWATHERNVVIFKELLYEIQQGNMTGALPLVLPFIGSSAESIRQCCIYPAHQNNVWSYQSPYQTYHYNFLEESHSNKSEQCYGDILALVDGLLPIVKDINTKDIFGLVRDFTKIFPVMKNTLKDCPSTIRKMDLMPYFNKTAALHDFSHCIEDVQQLSYAVKGTMEDIKAGNFAKVISDVMELISLAKKTVSDCTNSGKGIHLQNLLNYYPSQQCSEAAAKAGDVAMEAREALHSNKEKFVGILPFWIEAAKNAFNTCHRAPYTF